MNEFIGERTKPTTSADNDPGYGARPAILEFLPNWKWLVGIGIAAAVLGVIALAHVFATSVVSGFLIGLLMIGASIAQFFAALGASGFGRKLWWLVVAVLYLLAGALLVSNPLLGSALITLLLAFALVGAGISRIVFGFRLRPGDGWGWLVLSGIVSSIAGALIAIGWPGTIWALGLMVGIDILTLGISLVALGMTVRRGGYV